MKRVYVAGAYSGPDVLTVIDNMRRGLKLAADAQAAGFAVYVPWEDLLRHLMCPGGYSMSECYAASMKWLEVSDAVLVQPVRVAQSNGTRAELQRAGELGIPVFWSLEELEKHFSGGETQCTT